MIRLLNCIFYVIAISILTPSAFGAGNKNERDSLHLSGRVKESFGKTDLTNAVVVRYDAAGNPIDSIKTQGRSYTREGGFVDRAFFGFGVEKVDSTYTFDVVCPGYITQTVVYRVENVGKREVYRTIPTVFLEREPYKLKEVTVTASKIKFYNKGDTIVYNADAFQLAEGSMLDALIAQLPGVELNDDGQIKVNGEFVESLLLNGKQFLDGNNQLMLENIGAYTVKSVEVYKGQTVMEKWVGDPNSEKHLTMDVKLKREYNMGWIVNAQGGVGTEDRYSGRLFASWFTPTLKLSLIGNVNNLNDSRKPGQNDTWTPDMMPSGTREYRMGAVNYDYENPEETKRANGYVEVEHSSLNNRSVTARTNFLSGGNTYDNSFSRAKDRKLRVETRNRWSLNNDRVFSGGMVLGRHIRRDNGSSDISATFDREQADVTREVLEAIYSGGDPGLLESVINRSITRSDGSQRESEVQFYPYINWKVPGTNDNVLAELGVKYKDEKEERWRDYNINYGADPVPAVVKRQYFDNSPNRTLTLDGTIGYKASFGNLRVGLDYSYRFLARDRDSYMYALDRLADMGIYGTVPAGYLDSFDPENSYTSRLIENRHSISPLLSWTPMTGNSRIVIQVNPELALLHQHLDYWRGGRSYFVGKSYFLTVAKSNSILFMLNTGLRSLGGGMARYTNQFTLNYSMDTKTPDPLHRIDIVNDADPLNITLGNPNLKSSHIHKPMLSWNYSSPSATMTNLASLYLEFTDNALVRGYTYDTSTGIRRTRTYNVSGNSIKTFSNRFSYQFGNRDQFTLYSTTSASLTDNADMIGVDLQEPVKSKVRTANLGQNLKFDWQIGRQNLSVKGSFDNRHTTSTREDFRTIDARHFNYGFIGQFRLPGGFGINTDFTFYSRRGYGVRELDTTDAIWNVRLTYTPKGGRWVFMADGFDMLHQLSNVNYAVNASGRTVSYSNALPRYLLFSVQYRLNIQPKKRK